MKKFSKKLIPYYFVSSFVYSIFIFIMVKVNLVSEDGTVMPLANKIAFILAAVSYVVILIYSIIYYHKTGYELKQKEIYVTRGVLFKKQSLLDYSKIHAVNKKQGLIQRMFGLSTITIDSGSTNTSHQAEITIIESVEVTDNLIEEIKAKQNGEHVEISTLEEQPSKENLYHFTTKTKFIYSILNTLAGFIGVAIFAIFGIVAISILFNFIDTTDETVSTIEIFAGFLGLFIITTLGIALGGFLTSFVKYYDFKIYRTTDSIEINYGLFTKFENTFKLNRVKGIKIQEGLIKRLFGFVIINLEVIGYTNQSNNNQQAVSIGVLIPLCKRKDINHYLDLILPEYKPEEKEYSPIKFLPFISYYLIFTSAVFGLLLICALIPLFIYKLWTIALYVSIGTILTFILFMSFCFIEQFLEYKNSGITINENKLTISFGGFIKHTAVVLKDNIIGIENITTHHRKKEGIYSYIIHFKSNAMTNTLRVNNLSVEAHKKLLELMTY